MIQKPTFIHLHVHSDCSILTSCATIEKLVAKAKRLNMPSLAITDTGNMFGVMNFYNLCRENSIKPIIGQEFFLNAGNRLVLLCENEIGYKNISWLSSRSFCDENTLQNGKPTLKLQPQEVSTSEDCNSVRCSGHSNKSVSKETEVKISDDISDADFKPTINFELLKQYHEGLICLSGGFECEITQTLLDGKTEDAYETAKQYKELFGENHFYIELQNHGLEKEKIVAEELARLAQDLNIPLVATNDINYLEREDAETWAVLQCIGSNKKLSDLEEKICEEKYFKSKTEMEKSLSEIDCFDASVIKEAIENTLKIADMCNTEIPQYEKCELSNHLPKITLPNEFKTQDEYLRHIVEEGLKNRYKEITPEIRSRAEYEMETIFRLGFSGYYLFTWEFVTWAKSTWDNVNNRLKPYIATNGRGMAGGSLVAYCMGITDVAPIKYGLLFERFINPLRDAIPDFDLDVEFEHQEDVFQHFKDLYGENCVAGIAVFGTFRPLQLIKAVGRVLDISMEQIDILQDSLGEISMHFKLKDTLTPADENHPNNGCLLPFKGNAQYERLFEIALKLEDVKRSTAIHSSGIVVSQTDLPNWMPVFKDAQTGKVAVQYTRDIIEPCGLVKFDFLGLKTLSLINKIEKLITEKSQNDEFKISEINENDKETFELFSRGDTDKVFQFESPGMKKLLQEAKPNCIKDLMALNALYRPCSMDWIPTFIAGKNNPSAIKYAHPCLEEILGETYGVIVYQEQVMQIAKKIAGYSLAEADILRRDLGKKKDAVVVARKKEFTDAAVKNRYDAQTANEIFELLADVSAYTFNKSHAAIYTKLAYQMAWLKCHYPAEFTEAYLADCKDVV